MTLISLRTTHLRAVAKHTSTTCSPQIERFSGTIRLIFDDKAIEIVVNATNENARHKKAKFVADRAADSPEARQRPWRDVTPDEILAYLGISMWNTQPENGAIFDLIRRTMSLIHWEQISM